MRLRKGVLPFGLFDLLLVGAAWWAAFWLRFNFDIPDEFQLLAARSTPWILGCFAFGLAIARVHRQVWRYIGLPELRQLAGAFFWGRYFLLQPY